LNRDKGRGSLDSCNGWIRSTDNVFGGESIEAFFQGEAYGPHRHDTYSVGITLSGIQQFHYRKEKVRSPQGAALILHPDEVHDGEVGTTEGFGYRMLYLDPALINEALNSRSLPYLPVGTSLDPRLVNAVSALFASEEKPGETLQRDDSLFTFANILESVSARKRQQQARQYDCHAVKLARTFLLEQYTDSISLTTLEQISGLNRWQLTRDFRACFGTSPHRFLIMRRLDQVRAFIRKGFSLADAAFAAGFADQAHMSRHFKNTWGISPAKWRALIRE